MAVKFSIITAVYNAESCLERAINSVISQQGADFEFIVIDGGSKDNTVEIIKKYSEHISYWISERDRGIYDAWNKGVLKAKGEWILFLGADDLLLPDALHKYQVFIDTMAGPDTMYISSRIRMIDAKGNVTRVKGWPWEWPYFLREMTVAHPGSLHSRLLFEKYGLFNIDYKITGDYELLLRPKEELKTLFMDYITVDMSEGGASDSVAALKEHYKAATRTGGGMKAIIGANFLYILMKVTTKKFLRKWNINVYLKK